MELINPAFAEAEGGSRQPEQANLRVDLLQVAENLLVLAVVIIADTMTLIDDQQRKLPLKMVKIAGDGLHATKNHLTVALFAL